MKRTFSNMYIGCHLVACFIRIPVRTVYAFIYLHAKYFKQHTKPTLSIYIYDLQE